MDSFALPPPARVVWTHAAERRLQALVEQADDPASGYLGRMAEVDLLLAAAFPRASAVIVLDVYLSFRPRPGQYVVLVDVRGRERPGTAVVKLAVPDRPLRLEADAWEACRPAGFTGDIVFMEQERRYHPSDWHRLVAIVYQDARRHISTGRLISLEEAFLGAVRFGSPAPESIVAPPDAEPGSGVLNVLFQRVRLALHARARPPLAVGDAIELNPDETGRRRRLCDSLMGWQVGEPLEVRALVSASFWGPNGYRDGFLDPVRFFQAYDGSPPLRDVRVHRGPTHGDLHGRNVLVGIDDNAAVQPALFDYELMTSDNLVAWDFAKLETELKIRAYCHAFPFPRSYPGLPPREHVAAVWQFERQLAEHNDACREHVDGPTAREQNRMFRLLTLYRRLAAAHLEPLWGTHDGWEAEYLLVLAAYGLYTARWRLRAHERVAALLSAAAAAARLTRVLGIPIAENA